MRLAIDNLAPLLYGIVDRHVIGVLDQSVYYIDQHVNDMELASLM